jgi:taurine dioxygenase
MSSIPTFRRGPLSEIAEGPAAAQMRTALHEHGVLHIAEADPDDETLVSFARRFGVPDKVHPPAFRVPGQEYVRLQSNLPGLGVNGAGAYWHSDGPWSDPPCAATILLCVEAPERGGETLFADMRAALDRLPAELRRRIGGLRGWFPCREIYAAELEALGLEDDEKLAGLRDLEHPLVREHPVTGTRGLHLNEQWLRGVVGMSPAMGAELLEGLYAVATDPQFVYRHTWRAGDVVVWDNASMIHKGATSTTGRKVTKRVTVSAARRGGSP